MYIAQTLIVQPNTQRHCLLQPVVRVQTLLVCVLSLSVSVAKKGVPVFAHWRDTEWIWGKVFVIQNINERDLADLVA